MTGPVIRGPRVPADRVASMYADYSGGMSLRAVGRKYDRASKSVHELFVHRGLALRASPNMGKRRTVKGSFAPADAFTDAQVETMIAAATRISIPQEMRTEWRHWPLERRKWFVERLRARLPSRNDAPATACSEGVEAFAYGDARAHAVMADLNVGRNSWSFAVKINLVSQGVIWSGRLWFWHPESDGKDGGAYYQGPYTKERGRPALHRVIYEGTHGVKLGPNDIVRHRDGNRNNFASGNLVLCDRNDLVRESQARALAARSRELTGLLLNRSQSKNEPRRTHEPDTLSQIAARSRR